jgi:probable phosphoglycerate mutase
MLFRAVAAPARAEVELFLVRHGATEEFEAKRFGDHGLSGAGRAQADLLAESLREAAFDLCLVSPLRRAQETAARLVRGRSIPVETHACLAEGALGLLDGVDYVEATRRWPEDFRLGRTLLARLSAASRTAPGGETRAEFAARAREALELVRVSLFHPSTRALVISHGGLLAYLLQLLLGQEPRDDATIGFEFCAVARVISYREDPAFGPFAMLRFDPR